MVTPAVRREAVAHLQVTYKVSERRACSALDQAFNSLDAQYEAASAYIKSQAHARLDSDPVSL